VSGTDAKYAKCRSYLQRRDGKQHPMTGFVIREATTADVEGILPLMQASWAFEQVDGFEHCPMRERPST